MTAGMVTRVTLAVAGVFPPASTAAPVVFGVVAAVWLA